MCNGIEGIVKYYTPKKKIDTVNKQKPYRRKKNETKKG